MSYTLLHCLIRILFCPAETKYSNFSADFRLKIFLRLFLDYSARHFCFSDVFGAWMTLK